MNEINIVGQVIGGNVGHLLIRQKSNIDLELGDLLIAENDNSFLLLKVFELKYGSQVDDSSIEMASGLILEGHSESSFIDSDLRNYIVASVKAIANVKGTTVTIPKTMPSFFAKIRSVTKADLAFLNDKPENPILVGKVRSGSKVLDSDVYLNGEDLLTHHVLIPATTGRGKSNLVKIMQWSALNSNKFGILVLDPHDEYYGRHKNGLKDHPNSKENLVYYSPTAIPGCNTLKINITTLNPHDFDGIVDLSRAQRDAMSTFYMEHKEKWIEQIILSNSLAAEALNVNPSTIGVLQRKLRLCLGLTSKTNENGTIELSSDGDMFSPRTGEGTFNQIADSLEDGKIVVIDTSRLGDQAELLIGSSIANHIFDRHRHFKSKGILDQKNHVSIVLEEATRVLSEEKINQSDNIFSTIAREGRKFKVGLIAITQLTSVIPKMILTNINTKIILGNEMSTERHSIIESSSQDISDENRTIASLDKGEAIISSIFTKFPIPVKIPLFEDVLQNSSSEPDQDLVLD